MSESIEIGDLKIAVTRKAIKNVHLSVHPPAGDVTLTAPTDTRLDVVRAYAISRLAWIRKRQAELRNQPRETPRRFIERETHYLWGRPHLLLVDELDERPSVRVDHKTIALKVRPGSSHEKRAQVMHAWYLSQLHREVPGLIAKWQGNLHVEVSAYYLQRMKTKWGSCNPKRRHIRLNTELAKKPKDLLDYIVAHEMTHLIEPNHSERFTALMDEHYPCWREARAELNDLPLGAELWKKK